MVCKQQTVNWLVCKILSPNFKHVSQARSK
jgi:hypothetical protein